MRILSESPLVQNQFSEQVSIKNLNEMLRLVDLTAVRRNLFATLTQLMRSASSKQRLVEHSEMIIRAASTMLQAKAPAVNVNEKKEAITMLSQFTDSLNYLRALRES